MKIYFQRPSLRAELVYDGKLEPEEMNALVLKFQELITVEFMDKSAINTEVDLDYLNLIYTSTARIERI